MKRVYIVRDQSRRGEAKETLRELTLCFMQLGFEFHSLKTFMEWQVEGIGDDPINNKTYIYIYIYAFANIDH